MFVSHQAELWNLAVWGQRTEVRSRTTESRGQKAREREIRKEKIGKRNKEEVKRRKKEEGRRKNDGEIWMKTSQTRLEL